MLIAAGDATQTVELMGAGAKTVNFALYRRLCHASFSPGLEMMHLNLPPGQIEVATSVNTWHLKADHGFSYYHRLAQRDCQAATYDTRKSRARYLANGSAKLRELSRVLLNTVVIGGRRLLVFANWPMVQWAVEMFLVTLGFRTRSICSAPKESEKTETTRKFNDEHYGVDVLVTSYRTCAIGLNLHEQFDPPTVHGGSVQSHKFCTITDAVFLGPAINANTTIQAIGRVHRLGQRNQQQVTIIFQDNLFNQ